MLIQNIFLEKMRVCQNTLHEEITLAADNCSKGNFFIYGRYKTSSNLYGGAL